MNNLIGKNTGTNTCDICNSECTKCTSLTNCTAC